MNALAPDETMADKEAKIIPTYRTQATAYPEPKERKTFYITETAHKVVQDLRARHELSASEVIEKLLRNELVELLLLSDTLDAASLNHIKRYLEGAIYAMPESKRPEGWKPSSD